MVEHVDPFAAYLADDLARTGAKLRSTETELAEERRQRLVEGQRLDARHRRAAEGLRELLGLAEQAQRNAEALLRTERDRAASLEAQLAQERRKTLDLRQSAKRVERLLAEVVRGDGDQITLEEALRVAEASK